MVPSSYVVTVTGSTFSGPLRERHFAPEPLQVRKPKPHPTNQRGLRSRLDKKPKDCGDRRELPGDGTPSWFVRGIFHCGLVEAPVRNVSLLEATTPAPGNGYEGDKAAPLPPNLNRRRSQEPAYKEVKRHTHRMALQCSNGKCPVQSDAAAQRGAPKKVENETSAHQATQQPKGLHKCSKGKSPVQSDAAAQRAAPPGKRSAVNRKPGTDLQHLAFDLGNHLFRSTILQGSPAPCL
jgi:hypothetical protein